MQLASAWECLGIAEAFARASDTEASAPVPGTSAAGEVRDGPGGDGCKKILPTMLGHMYVGTGNNNQNGNQKCDDRTGIQVHGLNFGNMGEENFQMGMRKGYCLGNYNGNQNNQTFKVNYMNDGHNYMGNTTEPKGHSGMSSAHCASASSVTSGAASYDYGTNIPNY